MVDVPEDAASSDEDEWGAAELDLSGAAAALSSAAASAENKAEAVNDADYWDTAVPQQQQEATGSSSESKNTDKSKAGAKDAADGDDGGEPMILVDLTLLTKDQIHSKFDRNSVNDAAEASRWRKQIERDYNDYATKKTELIADGTVIPCGSSVWRAALVRLRDQRPGHYFVPIFPPKSK